MAETDEEELTTAGIQPAGFRGAAKALRNVVAV